MSDLDKTDATDKTTDTDLDGWTAVEEYANGTSSDAYTDSDGTEPLGGVFTTTYGNDRSVYLMNYISDTIDGNPVTLPNPDTLAAFKRGYRLYAKPNPTQGVAVSCDTLIGWTAMDSAAAEDTLAAWSLSPDPIMRAVPVGGCN